MARKASPGPLGISREVIRIIRGELGRSGMTQLDISRASGISQSQISRILSFDKELTVDQCDAICTALGICIETVIAEAQELSIMHETEPVTIGNHIASGDPLDPKERRELLNLHYKESWQALSENKLDDVAQRRLQNSGIPTNIDTLRGTDAVEMNQKESTTSPPHVMPIEDDGTVTEFNYQPEEYAADSSLDIVEERLARGEDPFD
ncbi:helix-turn-helix domain-containing protein [Corynebacterium diphtheriae]